jgi:hypothetical protein
VTSSGAITVASCTGCGSSSAISVGSIGQFNQTGAMATGPSGGSFGTPSADTIYIWPTNLPMAETITQFEIQVSTNAGTTGTMDIGLYTFATSGQVSLLAHCNNGGITVTSGTYDQCSLAPTVATIPAGTYFAAICGFYTGTAPTLGSVATSLAAGDINGMPAHLWGTDTTDGSTSCASGSLPSSITVSNITNNHAKPPLWMRFVP